jgi:hypothetical protein
VLVRDRPHRDASPVVQVRVELALPVIAQRLLLLRETNTAPTAAASEQTTSHRNAFLTDTGTRNPPRRSAKPHFRAIV